MELMPGYRQTEVGVIPEDWDVRSLQDLCKEEITYGIVQCGPNVPGGIPYIRVSDMDGPSLEREKMLCTSSQIASRFRRSEVRHGDIVYALRGRLGDVRSVPLDLDGANLTQGTARLSPSLKVHGPFLLWALRNPEVVLRACAESKGTTFMEITLSDLRQIKIALPPEPEQLKIASTLSDIEDHLTTLDLELAKKRNIKQAAMQELLTGKRRMPGFEGEWEVKMLKDIIKIPVTDGPHMTPRFLDTGVPFLSVNNLVNNRIDFGDLRFISKEDHCTFSRKCKPQKGDILLGKAASVGKVAIVDSDTEFNIWSPIALIRITENHSPTYVYYALQGQDLVGQISLLTNASSQGNIGMGDIEKLAFRLPGKEEQTAIASTLSELDAELVTLEARMEKVQQLTQGMMQQLLTGKIRLK